MGRSRPGSLPRLAFSLGFRVLACGQTAVPDDRDGHDGEEDGRRPEEADRSDDGEPINSEDGVDGMGGGIWADYYVH